MRPEELGMARQEEAEDLPQQETEGQEATHGDGCNLMIHRKKELFELGILNFATTWCQRNRDLYLAKMAHDNGYLAAAKKFFSVTGYLRRDEIKDLMENNIIPGWMGKCFINAETRLFGVSFYDHL